MLEGVKSPHPIEILWEGDKRYRGGIPGGPNLMVDGDRVAAPSPVDSILVSLGSCSAIDVVEILQKRRTPVASLRVEVDFSRAPAPPRRLTQVNMHFTIATESERSHVDRAVQLSVEKYCSVAASLAPDTELTWSVEVVEPASAKEAG